MSALGVLQGMEEGGIVNKQEELMLDLRSSGQVDRRGQSGASEEEQEVNKGGHGCS